MVFVLYFQREKDYYETLANLNKSGINPELRIAPYLLKCSANLDEMGVSGAELLTYPIHPSLLEKMADNVKIVAQALVAPKKDKFPSGLEGLPWDTPGKKAPKNF